MPLGAVFASFLAMAMIVADSDIGNMGRLLLHYHENKRHVHTLLKQLDVNYLTAIKHYFTYICQGVKAQRF